MTSEQCLKQGEHCDEFAELTLNNKDRDTFRDLANEWRALAAQDSYYKLCLTWDLA